MPRAQRTTPIRFQSDILASRLERSEPRKASNHSQGEFEMKQFLIVMSLLVASAAPVMAEGFTNPYQTQH